ncbi:DUF6000 family protein [Spirillospora sp. CA-294931]|uniref:DUF6000 family protein n=1 Tax=Spirillospora sp. CA-294931 TaxID=3240042 RepID=UPI003D8AC828
MIPLDQLAGSVPDVRTIGDTLVACGVRMSLGGSIYAPPADPMSKLFFNMLAVFAEFEADLLKMRTRGDGRRPLSRQAQGPGAEQRPTTTREADGVAELNDREADALLRHVFGTGDRPVPDLDPANAKAIRRYVKGRGPSPRYRKLIGGQFTAWDRPFRDALIRDARKIHDGDLDRLLSCGWRPRLTAAWLIGIDRRQQYRRTLHDLLLESAGPYAGRGYCFALARFGLNEDADILAAYLDRYLPREDCFYDQRPAIGALLYLDERLGTHQADRFVNSGLWQTSAFSDEDPTAYHQEITQQCAAVDRAVQTTSGI